MSQRNEEDFQSFRAPEASSASVPAAHNPPLKYIVRGSAPPQKSSLSSSPHYSTVYGGGAATSLTASVADRGSLGRESTGFSDGSGSGNTSTNELPSQFSSMMMGSRQYHKAGSNVSNSTGSTSNNINKNLPLSSTMPSQITFCPGWHNIVASINCVSSSTSSTSSSSSVRPPPRSMSSGSNMIGALSSFMGAPDDALSGKQAASSRKMGPIMLELQNVELVEGLLFSRQQVTSSLQRMNSNINSRGLLNLTSSLRNASDYVNDLDEMVVDYQESDSNFFTTLTVGVSRGNPSLGLSVASTCLSMSPVQIYDRIMAATGSTTGALCIHRFDADELDETDITNASVSGGTAARVSFSAAPIEYFHNTRHHRQASAVAWRPVQTNHVAIGLVDTTGAGSISHTSHHHHVRRSGPSVRTGGEREFCCFLWDINDSKKTTSPIQKLCHNSPVASLAWMMDGQTLVVGGHQRTIQLYDMRIAAGTNAPPLSAHAHESGVHSIEVDPHRPYLMATLCRAIGEPVKLFDIRRMESPVSEIKITNSIYQESSSLSSTTQRTQQGKAEAVQWSTLEPGILSIASGDSVQHYDTSSGSRPTLIKVNHVRAGSVVKDIALYRPKKERTTGDIIMKNRSGDDESHSEGEGDNDSDRLLSKLYPHRMLVVLEDCSIQDISIDTKAPLAISRRDGRLVHALGPHLWVGSPNEGPAAMEKTTISTSDDDISAVMMKRASCIQTSPYSMSPKLNIKLLSREIAMEDGLEPTDLLAMNYSNRKLLRLWSWIDRVESLSFQEVEDLDDDTGWAAKSILDAGVWQLLERDTNNGNGNSFDEINFSETLGCNTYDSPARRAALTACGWAGKYDLAIVMAECESLGEFERSAALAVWHENVGAAVVALQRGSRAVRLQIEESTHASTCSQRYAETLDLIGMCIAGFGGKMVAQMAVWKSACASLLQREDLSLQRAKESRIAYLRGLCEFLLNVGTGDNLGQVLENPHLSLCDRLAFACRFLGETKLTTFLQRCVEECQRQGNIEGLVVTGVGSDGVKILQSFVDIFSDVQTAALVVSRVVLPVDGTAERRICLEWVEFYRGLLNNWQMWQSRAMFDVDRAEVLRRVKSRMNGTSYQRRIPANPRSRQSPRPLDPDILPSIPAQLEVRCNYCSSPLSLRRNEGMTNQWLSKMQPLLNCCPQCRKPLPRCSICLLSLGGLNPYMELTRQRQGSARGSTGKSIPSSDDLSSLSSMSFAEWYTWCMRCRHGGHAHHMLGWFSNQKTCPVSGCNCECEFDGVLKLNRPAMYYEASNEGSN